MSGFTTYPADCLILLFGSWKLDSAASFTVGCLGTALLGIITEGLTMVRRTRLTKLRWRARRPRLYVATLGAAFSVQATLGYFLMLAAMTYQVEVFIAVIVGLGCGHVLFNVQQPVAESTDACCVQAVDESAESPQQRTA